MPNEQLTKVKSLTYHYADLLACRRHRMTPITQLRSKQPRTVAIARQRPRNPAATSSDGYSFHSRRLAHAHFKWKETVKKQPRPVVAAHSVMEYRGSKCVSPRIINPATPDEDGWLVYGNKMPSKCNRGFYCRSYCLFNMFRAPLCPSSGAQEHYTVVAACGISCCGFQVTGLVWSWGLCVRFAGCCSNLKTTARNTTGSNHCIILLSSWRWA